jgi:hypothetical protein
MVSTVCEPAEQKLRPEISIKGKMSEIADVAAKLLARGFAGKVEGGA